MDLAGLRKRLKNYKKTKYLSIRMTTCFDTLRPFFSEMDGIERLSDDELRYELKRHPNVTVGPVTGG